MRETTTTCTGVWFARQDHEGATQKLARIEEHFASLRDRYKQAVWHGNAVGMISSTPNSASRLLTGQVAK